MRLIKFLLGSASIIILSTGLTHADQTKMDEALKYLQIAKDTLDMAPPDISGHRERALKLVEQAIKEVNEGRESPVNSGSSFGPMNGGVVP